MIESLSGAEFKKQLREGRPKLGIFLNAHSPTVAEQMAHSGYDWLLVDTADCIKNIDEIAAVPGVDILFLGQNDLCMSMGLYEKYKFPDMYTSPEMGEATEKLKAAARKNNVILGLFLFGTARVGEFLDKGIPFMSIGNDLHHILTQATSYVKDVEPVSKEKGHAPWARRAT